MSERRKKKVRCTNAQKEKLIELMAEHRDLAMGNFSICEIGLQNAQWENLAAILDELGPSKTIDQWKTTWRDLKSRARASVTATHRPVNTTDDIILSVIGSTQGQGQAGGSKSPVFVLPTTPPSQTQMLPSPPQLVPSPQSFARSTWPTLEQINFLHKYMTAYPEFATGACRSQQKIDEEWVSLKQTLDELGPQKTVDQWKICWRDQICQVRVEAGAHTQDTTATDNTIASFPEILEGDAIISSAIEPDESPRALSPIEEPGPHLIQRPSPRRRIRRRTLLPYKYPGVQPELNQLLRELITEVRRGNDLREEQLNLLRSSQ